MEERQGHQGNSKEMDISRERTDICWVVASDTEFRIRRMYREQPQDMNRHVSSNGRATWGNCSNIYCERDIV